MPDPSPRSDAPCRTAARLRAPFRTIIARFLLQVSNHGGDLTATQRAQLFPKILQCDLDAVVELFANPHEMIASVRRALDELDNLADRGMRFPFDLGRAADVHRTIEVKVAT